MQSLSWPRQYRPRDWLGVGLRANRRLAAVVALLLLSSTAQPARAATSLDSPGRPVVGASPLFTRSVQKELGADAARTKPQGKYGARPPVGMHNLQSPTSSPTCVLQTLSIDCVQTIADCTLPTSDSSCTTPTTSSPTCVLQTLSVDCVQTVAGCTLPTSDSSCSTTPTTSSPTCVLQTLSVDCVQTVANCTLPTSDTSCSTTPTTSSPTCVLQTLSVDCVQTIADCTLPTSDSSCSTIPTTSSPTCVLQTLSVDCVQTIAGCTLPTSDSSCTTPTTDSSCMKTTTGSDCSLPTSSNCTTPTTSGCALPTSSAAGCSGTVTPSDWVLHLVPVDPFSLSEEPGAKAVGLSFRQLRFGLKLPGPVAGSPYRWSFFFRNGTAQAVEASARLVWVPAKGDVAPKQVASWSIPNITPTDPKNPQEVAPRHGVVTDGLDLLNVLPGDMLVLEVTGPVDASGKPMLEFVVGGSANQVGDSLVGLANGPAVTLGLEPTVLNASVGGKYPFKATVRVGGGQPVEGALIRWECRASGSGPPPGTITQDGVLSAAGEGSLRVVAHYTGKEAVASVSIAKAPSPPPGTPSGDVNGDGAVGVADATLALRAAVGLLGLDPAALARADMNGNGKADIADATMILRKAVGLS